MRLSGKYIEVNYIDFDIPSVEDITLVPGTTFRFVLVVKDSLADDEPKYFVMEEQEVTLIKIMNIKVILNFFINAWSLNR